MHLLRSLLMQRLGFLAAILLAWPALAPAQIKDAKIDAWKKSMVAVSAVGSDFRRIGFCIAESGVFITSTQNLNDEPSAVRLQVTVNPGAAGEKSYPVESFRVFKTQDIAVLTVKLDRQVPALKLGDAGALQEGQSAFAMEFRDAKAPGMPADTRTGFYDQPRRISFGKNGKDPAGIRPILFDRVVPYRCAGGPVLDENGTVVGYVKTPYPAHDDRVFMPIVHFKNLLETAPVSILPHNIAFKDRFEPADFAIDLKWLLPPAVEPKITVTVHNGEKSRSADAVKGADQKYRARIAPVAPIPADPQEWPGPVTYDVKIVFANGTEKVLRRLVLHFTDQPAIAAPPTTPMVEGKVDVPGTREIPIPSPISSVAAAAGGRLLLLHLADAQRIAVFDVVDLKIRGYIKLESQPVKFAGGGRHILVALPSLNVIHRYSVQTLEKEKTIPNPFGASFDLGMGYASANLALFAVPSTPTTEARIFNTDTMSVEAIIPENRSRPSSGSTWNDVVVNASADGETYVTIRRELSPTGINILTYKNRQWKFYYKHTGYGTLAANSNGSLIFSQDMGVFLPDGTNIVPMKNSVYAGVWMMPSYHPLYFFGVPYHIINDNAKDDPRSMMIYTGREATPLLSLPEFPEMKTPNQYNIRKDSIGLGSRFHYYPQLKFFLTIPFTNDKIVVHPFDLEKSLKEKDIDYLYINSVPPSGRLNQPYLYNITAASKAGDTQFALVAGPEGMKIAPDGKVTWTPNKIGRENVSIKVRNGIGQELSNTFPIEVYP